MLMNRKGFMMAELVIVSAIIITTLTVLFLSYGNLIINYNNRINYYDVGVIYRLGYYYRNGSITYTNDDYKVLDIGSNTINNIIYKDSIIVIKSSFSDFSSITDINETFKDYLVYFKNSVTIDSNNDYYLIMESCQTKNGETKCKYGYQGVKE